MLSPRYVVHAVTHTLPYRGQWLPITPALPGKGLLPINAAWTAAITSPADYSCVTLPALVIHIMYFFHYAPGLACRGSTSLYVPPLNYKREGTQRYRGHAQHTQYNLHIVEVGYYAPAAWTTIIHRVLSCSSRIHQTGNRLGPLLILGLGRVRSATRTVDFPTDRSRLKTTYKYNKRFFPKQEHGK
jgi:hypothetical protein